MVATGFLILAGDNLHNLLPDVKIDIYGFVNICGRPSFVLLVVLIMTPTVWLNNMTALSYVSATRVVASLIILGSVLWWGYLMISGFAKWECLEWTIYCSQLICLLVIVLIQKGTAEIDQLDSIFH